VQPLREADDNGILDRMVDDSPQLTFWLFENNNSGSLPKSTASNGQTAEEMDPRDLLALIKNSIPTLSQAAPKSPLMMPLPKRCLEPICLPTRLGAACVKS